MGRSVLHIGDFKTGSTWLQQFFFPKLSSVDYIGKSPSERPIRRAIQDLIYSRDLDFSAGSFQKLFDRLLQQRESTTHPWLISAEAFSGGDFVRCEHAARTANRLKEVFGDIKVIYVVRNPTTMIMSLYSEYVKVGGTLGFREFVFDPLHSSGLFNRLQYARNVRHYHQVFGDSSVLVLVYEELVKSPSTFLGKITNFIDAETVAVDQLSMPYANQRLSFLGLWIKKYINRFIRSRFNSGGAFLRAGNFPQRLLCEQYRRKLHDLADNDYLINHEVLDRNHRLKDALNRSTATKTTQLVGRAIGGRPAELPDSIREYLVDQTKESNSYLKDLGLPLQHFGWDC